MFVLATMTLAVMLVETMMLVMLLLLMVMVMVMLVGLIIIITITYRQLYDCNVTTNWCNIERDSARERGNTEGDGDDGDWCAGVCVCASAAA